MNGYRKISEAFDKRRLSARRINTLCLEGGVEDAKGPGDERVKSGNYIKKETEA